MNSLPNVTKYVNPHLVGHFASKTVPRHAVGFRSIIHADACQRLLDKLDLPSKYPDSSKRLDIVDAYSGYGLLSTMINEQLKPRNHVILENQTAYRKAWEERMEILQGATNNSENFRLVTKSAYEWETYSQLVKDKLIEPKTQSRDKVHDELLIVANLTTQFGESLLAQWIMCTVYQNWLQKYGRIRMICIIAENTAVRFWSGPNFSKRNKSAIKREWFTDSHLIAINDHARLVGGEQYDPNLLVKDQPILIPTKSISPAGGDLAVVEVVPKKNAEMDVSLLEFMLQEIMYKPLAPVKEAYRTIYPGIDTDLLPKIPKELLEKPIRNLSIEEFNLLFQLLDNWAFKPTPQDRIGVFLSSDEE